LKLAVDLQVILLNETLWPYRLAITLEFTADNTKEAEEN